MFLCTLSEKCTHVKYLFEHPEENFRYRLIFGRTGRLPGEKTAAYFFPVTLLM